MLKPKQFQAIFIEKNQLTKLLTTRGFEQLITQPTHDQGRTIDQCYVPIVFKDKVQLKIFSPYYTDHDAICINLEI